MEIAQKTTNESNPKNRTAISTEILDTNPFRQARLKKNSKLTIQVSGVLSMVIAVFLFTGYHDMVINIASLFGLIATIGTIAALFKLRWKKLFWMGMFNIILFALNNILYYGGSRFYLPVVQKITFAWFLLWICGIQLNLYRGLKTNENSMTI